MVQPTEDSALTPTCRMEAPFQSHPCRLMHPSNRAEGVGRSIHPDEASTATQ